MIPSAAQGAIAIASRTNENELNNLLKSISCSSTFHCVSQERQFLKLMNGGCSVPISAFAKIEGDKLVFKASISSMDSKNIIKVEDSFDCNDLNTGEKMYKKMELAWKNIYQAISCRPSNDRTICVTSSPLTQWITPSSTLETWNIVFTIGSLAPPSQNTTCPIHQLLSTFRATNCSACTITKSPELTLRNAGASLLANGLLP